VRLTREQRYSLSLLVLIPPERLFISEEMLHLLRKFAPPTVEEFMRGHVRVLYRTRYQSRWSRRLRHSFGFSREDAHLLALATFGTDSEGVYLGVDLLVTFDRHLIEHFYLHLPQIEAKLRRMTSQLRPPFSQAILPELVTPDEIIHILTSPSAPRF